MTTTRRPRLPICTTCNHRHHDRNEYLACARTHAAAQQIIVRQIASSMLGNNLEQPQDILNLTASLRAREIERSNLLAQGIITVDTLPTITAEQCDRAYGVVERDDEWGMMARAHLLAGDRWCWYQGRGWSRRDERLRMRLMGERVAS